MSILTQSGRAAIAASIKKQSIHLAWGTGDSSWESSHKVEKTFVKGEIKFDHQPIFDRQPIKDVKVFTGQTTYQPSIDYTVNGSTGVIKLTENSSIPVSDKVTVEYSESTPPELITSEKLLNELGRRTADEVLFCTGDENGELITPSGRFRPSNVPTNNLVS